MISERIKRMSPSATIELQNLVTDLKSQGVDIIGMNVGEPDFETPSNIVDACKKALADGKTRYCNSSGIPPLRAAIAAKLKRDNAVTYEVHQIVVSTGAKQALNNAVLAICNPGDEIIIPTPCWVSYVEIVKLADGVPILVPTNPADFSLDLDAIEKAITPKTRAVIINTPNNPTGAVYREESLRRLGELAVKYNFYVISDEVYEKLIYGSTRHVSIASLSSDIYQHAVVINGFSKAYAMTGWRLGYSAAPNDVSRAMASLQGHTTSNSTTFVQWAGLEALQGPQHALEDMRKQFDRRRLYLVERLKRFPGVTCPTPDGAFYLMPDVSYYFGKKTLGGEAIGNSKDFCNYVLKTAHVAIVPGDAFEAPRCVRISYSNTLENIQCAMDRMEQALAQLR